MSVMRGQIFNLREALRTRKSPLALVQMPPTYLVEVKRNKRRSQQNTTADSTVTANGATIENRPPPLAWHDAYRQKVPTRGPFFSWC